MTPTEQATAAQALADRLAALIDGQPHDVVLLALIAMYRTTALQHPCCTKYAAEQCMSVGLQLVLQHAKQHPPSGASIH